VVRDAGYSRPQATCRLGRLLRSAFARLRAHCSGGVNGRGIAGALQLRSNALKS
jgi:hypothetical protein